MNSQNDIKNSEQTENNMETPKSKNKKWKKVSLWILIGILSFMIAIGGTVLGLYFSGKSSLLDNPSMNVNPGDTVDNVQVEQDGKTVFYNGKKYVYNENMTTVLCIGVDKESLSNIGTQGLNGQADALFLYAMDTETGKSTVIPIPRDTMAEVDLYSSQGKYVSSAKTQICLSYAYGDGKNTSCENTLKSVQRLFYGLPINSYVAIDLRAIDVLSSKVGGVTVTPSHSFSCLGYSFKKGQQVTLTGKKARAFVQSRDDSKLDSSLIRMSNQKQFLTEFFSKALSKTKKDISFPVDVYNSTSKYMITDINVAEVSFLSTTVLKGGSLEFKSIDGEMKKGEKYAEFHADDTSIYNTIIDVFYKPAD